MDSLQVTIAAVKAQNDLLDMEIALYRAHIERLDAMIARVTELRKEIESQAVQEVA